MTYRSLNVDRIESARLCLRASYYLALGITAPADRELWNTSTTTANKEDKLSGDQQYAKGFFIVSMNIDNYEAHHRSPCELYRRWGRIG